MSQQNASVNTSFDRKVCCVNSKAHENNLPSQISAGVTLFLFSHHKVLPIIFKEKISPIRRMRKEEPKDWHIWVWPMLSELALNGWGPLPVCASPDRALRAPALPERCPGSVVIAAQLKLSQSPKLPFTKDAKTDSTEHLCKTFYPLCFAFLVGCEGKIYIFVSL